MYYIFFVYCFHRNAENFDSLKTFQNCNEASQLLEDSLTCNKFKAAKGIKLVCTIFHFFFFFA